MIRTACLMVLIVTWIMFVVFEKKNRLDYLPTSIAAAMPGEVLDWRSEKLYFEGWSSSELTHRWSNTRRPTVCFKPQPNPRTFDGAISMAFIMTMVEPLIGRSLPVLINGQMVSFKPIASQPSLLNYQRRSGSKEEIICATFELPLTVRVGADPRNLGLSFDSLIFRYAAESTPMKPAS